MKFTWEECDLITGRFIVLPKRSGRFQMRVFMLCYTGGKDISYHLQSLDGHGRSGISRCAGEFVEILNNKNYVPLEILTPVDDKGSDHPGWNRFRDFKKFLPPIKRIQN